MIQQAYKYASSSFWPCLPFLELKITNILKSSGWGLEKSELPWERKPVAFQSRSVIGERNNRRYNRNNAPSLDNKESYRSNGRMKIEVWKSYRITDGNKIFIAASVFPVELLACQVSMICAAKCIF